MPRSNSEDPSLLVLRGVSPPLGEARSICRRQEGEAAHFGLDPISRRARLLNPIGGRARLGVLSVLGWGGMLLEDAARNPSVLILPHLRLHSSGFLYFRAVAKYQRFP